MVAGTEATYTEHDSDTSEKPENRSKSGAHNHLDLQLKDLLATVIGLRGSVGGKPISRLPTSAPGP